MDIDDFIFKKKKKERKKEEIFTSAFQKMFHTPNYQQEILLIRAKKSNCELSIIDRNCCVEIKNLQLSNKWWF